MRSYNRWVFGLFFLWAVAGTTACSRVEVYGPVDPAGIFLTWQRDPTSTMTIDWHTLQEQTYPSALVFREKGQRSWKLAEGAALNFPFSDRRIHRVELTGLKPGATYEFQFNSAARTYAFRTMPPAQTRPIRFAAGGDTRHRQDWMEQTNRAAMQYDLDFALWGGDLAYADGREDRLDRWYEWFDAIKNTLIAEDGRVIPILVGIGNHEVQGGYYSRHEDYEQTDAWRAQIAPYYYGLFAFPNQPGYRVLDFGNYLSIILLDTNHSNPIEGAQTEWLARVLSERQNVPHVFPIYHVPAYPSHRSFSGSVSQLVRAHWVPLFEQYGVRAAFENHDHTYKRTHPIREGAVHPDGIVYLGDGAWGVGTRSGNSFGEWYIAKADTMRHFVLTTLDGAGRHFLTVDENGSVIDEYAQTR